MKERYLREIMSGFPYPVIVYFIKLRTDECLDPGPLRLKYILATAETISRFLGVISLCECREFQEFADLIGEDGYAENAPQAVQIAQELVGT